MEHRKDARFAVQFWSSFSSANVVFGEGALSDLSIRGCCVFSLIEVKPGTVIQLHVHASDHETPIQIFPGSSSVVSIRRFWCEFVNLGPDEWARLHDVGKRLEMQPFQREKRNREVA